MKRNEARSLVFEGFHPVILTDSSPSEDVVVENKTSQMKLSTIGIVMIKVCVLDTAQLT